VRRTAGRSTPEESSQAARTPTAKTAGVFTIADFDNNTHSSRRSIPPRPGAPDRPCPTSAGGSSRAHRSVRTQLADPRPGAGLGVNHPIEARIHVPLACVRRRVLCRGYADPGLRRTCSRGRAAGRRSSPGASRRHVDPASARNAKSCALTRSGPRREWPPFRSSEPSPLHGGGALPGCCGQVRTGGLEVEPMRRRRSYAVAATAGE
jgi:hypothetical protein